MAGIPLIGLEYNNYVGVFKSSYKCVNMIKSHVLLLHEFTDSNTCISPPPIVNGNVSPNVASSPVNTILTYTCNFGYHLSPATYTVMCENDGNTADWSETFPVCGE